MEGQARARIPYTRRDLKWRVYGTDRPGLGFEIQRAVECARRHRDPRRLEADFPHGFGTLARDLRGWRRQDAEGK